MRPSAPPTIENDRKATPAAPPALDRTTFLVRLGLVVLAVTGVITIFGESLLGLGDSKDVSNAGSPPATVASAARP